MPISGTNFQISQFHSNFNLLFLITIATIISIISGWLDQVICFHFYSYLISIIAPSYLYNAGLLICNITYPGLQDITDSSNTIIWYHGNL